MRIINRKINPTMVELIIGIVFYAILIGTVLLGLYIFKVPIEKTLDDSIFNIVLGFIVGILYSLAATVYMARTVEIAIEMGEDGATKHTRIAYAIRLVCLIVIFVVMLVVNIGNIVSMFIGLLSLKLSAYVQPITHKLKEKLKKGR